MVFFYQLVQDQTPITIVPGEHIGDIGEPFLDKLIIMRYNVSRRFQGAFLGAAVGEMLDILSARKSRDRLRMRVNWWDVEQIDMGIDQLLPGWGSNAMDACKSLIARGSVEGNSQGNGYEATGYTLPIALFFHEDVDALLWQLHQVAQRHQYPEELRDGTLAIGYCLSQTAKENLDSYTIIPQIITYLQSSGSMAKQLAQVQTLLEQGASLETARRSLSNSIPLAFYCFLSTSEDFRLSVLRAVGTGAGKQSKLVAALTGAMSGSYNSLGGIPVQWRMALNSPSAGHFLHRSWGVTSDAEIGQLATQLLAAWSGAYSPTHPDPSQVYAVAALE